MIYRGIIYFIIIIQVFSCREDFEQVIIEPQNFEPELLENYQGEVNLVISSVKGIVVDKENNPLSNATVYLGSLQTVTDQYGHFFFTDESMNALGTVININLEGYHKGSTLFYPVQGATENLEITLNPYEALDELSSGTEGEIRLVEDIILSYSENSFLDTNGAVYQGLVSIHSSYSTKAESAFSDVCPGNFQAVDIQNSLVGLSASGLLQINFLDEDNNQLTINSDSELFLDFQDLIESESEAWYYAEQYGLYTVNSDLSASKIRYRHHTPILIGQTLPTTQSTLSLTTANGQSPLENMEVNVKDESGLVIFKGFTNSLGQIQLNTLTNGQSNLEVKDACGEIVFNDNIQAETNSLSFDQIELKTYSGDVYDCEVNPSMDNVIRIEQGSRVHYFYENQSNFELRLQTCDEGLANVTATEDPLGLSGSTNIDLLNDTTLGDLFTCISPTINQLSIIDLDSGQEYRYPISSTVGSTSALTSFGHFESEGQEFRIVFSGTEVGFYSDANAHSIERIWDDNAELRIAGDGDLFEVVRFGDKNKITLGNFKGQFENSITNELINIEGRFNFYFFE